MKLAEIENRIRQIPRVQLAGLVKEYIAESQHNGWDGFRSSDLTGIRRFLEDMIRYYDSTENKGSFEELSNVSPVE